MKFIGEGNGQTGVQSELDRESTKLPIKRLFFLQI